MTSGVVLLHLLLLLVIADCYKYKPKQARCERITIPLCSDIPYNYTRMPNLLGHATQQEAAAQVHEFIPLVQIGCSRLLKFFLCAEYAPMCTEQVDEVLVIPPCRSMCLEVRSHCEPVLQRFNFHWPTSLDCDALPVRSDRIDLCIEPPGQDDRFPSDGEGDEVMIEQLPPDVEDGSDDDGGGGGGLIRLVNVAGGGHRSISTTFPREDDELDLNGQCSDRFIPVVSTNDVADDTEVTCMPRCRIDVTFRADDKGFSDKWLITWSALSFTSSLITVLTFIIDTSRFRYPERPVVFICLCSAMYAAAHLVRAVAGRDVTSCDSSSSSQVHGDIRNACCVVVAVLLHYFGTAGAIWWAMLTISWYLAAARKWGEEAIWSLSKYFHLVCWSLPAISTAVAVSLHKVDADELTGLCYIGSASASGLPGRGSSIGALIAFVLAPMVLCLIVGTGFVGAGFSAVRRVRRTLQQRQSTAIGVDRLERLMVKMAVFSALYAAPVATVLGCLIYEFRRAPDWYRIAAQSPCNSPTVNGHLLTTASTSSVDCRLKESAPIVEVFLVKTFAALMPGIAGGVWIWSMKTARSWRHFFQRCLMTSSPSNRSHRIGGYSSPSYLGGGSRWKWSGGSGTDGGYTGSSFGRMVRWPGGIVTTPPPVVTSSMTYQGKIFTTVN